MSGRRSRPGPATLGLPHGRGPSSRPPRTSTGEGRTCVLRPPLAVERQGRLRDDVARVTQDLARELEALIRRAPEQWHLMEPNWPSDREVLGARSRGGPT
ncbi:MAG: hypothetical protein U5R31_10070 [Acidimicrobiia bacterium]|nr:hypothetical protein [Acidimicrobiia bacterium]